MVKGIGTPTSWVPIAKRSHNWGNRMNEHMVKLAVLTQGSVKSRTTTVPTEGEVGDAYIHPSNKKVYVWIPEWNDGDEIQPGQWYVINPQAGLILMVLDENKWYAYGITETWEVLWDPEKSHRAIAREFSFYVPYLVRPRSTLFSYVATQETTIEAGAPGSGAYCDVPPIAPVTFNILKGGGSVGSIEFAAGEHYGNITLDEDQIIVPTIEEGMYMQANSFSVRSGEYTYGMEGLNVTIAAKIRSID